MDEKKKTETAIAEHLLRREVPFESITPEDWVDIMGGLNKRYYPHYKDLFIFESIMNIILSKGKSGIMVEKKSDDIMERLSFPENLDDKEFNENISCCIICSAKKSGNKKSALDIEIFEYILFTIEGEFLRMENHRTRVKNDTSGKLKTTSCKISRVELLDIVKEYPRVCIDLIWKIREAVKKYILKREREIDPKREMAKSFMDVYAYIHTKPKR